MYERMLDKSRMPDLEQICNYMGEDSYARMGRLEALLAAQYNLTKELRFPFGSHYGWGYKYSQKSSHLCYAFFERGAFTIMIQVGDRQVPVMEKALPGLSQKSQDLWANRYPCGDHGGWIQYRILEDYDLPEIIQFIHAKKSPPK